eukprot:scaffold979_cov382-Prasinococcus_capsulatus_cf.AAC.13
MCGRAATGRPRGSLPRRAALKRRFGGAGRWRWRPFSFGVGGRGLAGWLSAPTATGGGGGGPLLFGAGDAPGRRRRAGAGAGGHAPRSDARACVALLQYLRYPRDGRGRGAGGRASRAKPNQTNNGAREGGAGTAHRYYPGSARVAPRAPRGHPRTGGLAPSGSLALTSHLGDHLGLAPCAGISAPRAQHPLPLLAARARAASARPDEVEGPATSRPALRLRFAAPPPQKEVYAPATRAADCKPMREGEGRGGAGWGGGRPPPPPPRCPAPRAAQREEGARRWRAESQPRGR